LVRLGTPSTRTNRWARQVKAVIWADARMCEARRWHRATTHTAVAKAKRRSVGGVDRSHRGVNRLSARRPAVASRRISSSYGDVS